MARASELRFKISNCIDRSGSNRGREADPGGGRTEAVAASEEEEEEEEESLLSIRDALESLERQLGALQVFIYFSAVIVLLMSDVFRAFCV